MTSVFAPIDSSGGRLARSKDSFLLVAASLLAAASPASVGALARTPSSAAGCSLALRSGADCSRCASLRFDHRLRKLSGSVIACGYLLPAGAAPAPPYRGGRACACGTPARQNAAKRNPRLPPQPRAAQIGLEALAGAFAYGAIAVRFLLRAKPRHDLTGPSACKRIRVSNYTERLRAPPRFAASTREVIARLKSQHRSERAFRGGRRDRVPQSMQARLRGHRIEAARLALSLGAFATSGEGQEPQSARCQARGRGGLGPTQSVKVMREAVIIAHGGRFNYLVCAAITERRFPPPWPLKEAPGARVRYSQKRVHKSG